MAGIYEGNDLADKTLYGFRLNPDNGNLDIEIINDGSVVALPQDGAIDKYDYKQWFWSRDMVRFSWNNKGHLIAEFV